MGEAGVRSMGWGEQLVGGSVGCEGFRGERRGRGLRVQGLELSWLVHTRTRVRSHAHTRARARTHTHTHTHKHTRARARMRTHTRTNARNNTRHISGLLSPSSIPAAPTSWLVRMLFLYASQSTPFLVAVLFMACLAKNFITSHRGGVLIRTLTSRDASLSPGEERGADGAGRA